MTNTLPLVLMDPYPRTNAMILSPSVRAKLHQIAEVVTVESGSIPDDVIDACLPRVVAILGQTRMDAKRLSNSPNLRAIFNVEGNFLQNIDYAACFARGIRVASVAPAFARSVAEYALALGLDLCRGVTHADRLFRQGKESYGWKGNKDARSLFKSNVGFIGFGNIAKALMPLLAPFGCFIRAYDPWVPDNVIRELGATASSLHDLLQNSNIVFVLAAPTQKNSHFIAAHEIAMMQPHACLVVLSRAEVVDFEALKVALDANKIQAAIDVFPEEPVALNDSLRSCESAILSAHRAGGLHSTLQLIGEMAIDDLELVIRGLPPVRLQSAHPENIHLWKSRMGVADQGNRFKHHSKK